MKFKNALIIILLTISPMLSAGGPGFLREDMEQLILIAKITAGTTVCLGIVGTYLIIKKYFDMKNKIDELERRR